MPSPIKGSRAPARIEVSAETPTEALNHKLLEEKLNENDIEQELQRSERLGFLAQARIVRQGFSKGVRYDGCTAVPDFDFGADCCGEHDYHYQIGDISRWQADKRMRKCIRKKGYFLLPWAYWLGVRMFAGGVWDKYRKKQNETVSDNPGPDDA